MSSTANIEERMKNMDGEEILEEVLADEEEEEDDTPISQERMDRFTWDFNDLVVTKCNCEGPEEDDKNRNSL